ncbi:uncharacterized protein LOC128674698 isoform X2 [Plodia interpunctella]|uniref:uncharacterized protein LOC128674698 isoform X2 n=1 Tax=Plodia interpunctella TaxID=58824 RepID=UPI0023678765|nr:uncharacterized protein LOC128674698 isoform X2 [Plodia interpunctella]
METCVRGFSFMPQENVSMESLQYIEGEELTRKWRASRRERLKQREQRIWEEFVEKENDVLATLCKDDPYQFLEQLPEECLKEMMAEQLKKMQEEIVEEEVKIVENETGRGDSAPHVVTFAEDVEREEMFTIFDDKEEDKSAPEDEGTDSLSPSTVRELSPDSRAISPDKGSSKSSENVANVIENSIYFAKVKDLKNRMSEELANIVLALERRDVLNIDPADLVKMCRRSTEFCSRFNRVHMYQINRQINDLERNNNVCLPFAKHTQFQAQMVRIASLHQNMLQAFQIFHRSIEQTACVRESIDTLRALVSLCRRGSAASRRHLAAAGNLSADKMIPSCDGLVEAINEYAAKLSSYMDSTENTHTSHSRRSLKTKGKKSTIGSWSHKSGIPGKSVSGTRLSMYSLDTMRINLKPKSSKEISSGGTSKVRCNEKRAGAGAGAGAALEARDHRKPVRKRSPRSRRPLMRDPNSGRTKTKRKMPKETEIRTMVETVGTITCTSSRVSCVSPLPPLKSPRRRSKDATPRSQRSKEAAPRKPPAAARFKRRPPSPPMKEGSMKAALTSISNVIPETSAIVRPIMMSDKRIDTQRKVPLPVPVKQCEMMTETPRSMYASAPSRSSARSADVTPRATDAASVLDTPRVVDTPKVTETPKSASEIARTVGEASRGESSRQEERAGAVGGAGGAARRGEMITAEKRCELARARKGSTASARCEVTRIVRQLCGGDTAGSRNERVTGAKNAQLMCVNGSSSPRQPSTPQLLRILEETIQKKVPKQLFQNMSVKDSARFRMTFNIPELTADKMFQYRTKFVQHMLASPMYANSLRPKPWELISRISDQLIDELVGTCAKEMQMEGFIQRLYNLETR